MAPPKTEETVRSTTPWLRLSTNNHSPKSPPPNSPIWPTPSTNPPLNRSSKWTTTMIATLARGSSLVSSSRPKAHSKRWRKLCTSYPFSSCKRSPLIQNRKDKNLSDLSSLGHFLKGSSATLGLNKVKEACEKIQHYGAGKDETGTADEPDEKVSLSNIEKILGEVKKDYKEVESFLRKFYGETPEKS